MLLVDPPPAMPSPPLLPPSTPSPPLLPSLLPPSLPLPTVGPRRAWGGRRRVLGAA